MLSDVIRTNPDVSVTTCAWATGAAQKVTAWVPIVNAAADSPLTHPASTQRW